MASETFVFPRLKAFEAFTNIGRVDFCEPHLSLKEKKVHEVFDDKLGFSRLYTEDGELLILVAGYYGAPWSLWNKKPISQQLRMDARIVKFFYNTYIAPLIGKKRSCSGCGFLCSCRVPEEPMQAFLATVGLEDVDTSGLRHLQIHVIPPATKFKVMDNSGTEEVVLFDASTWESS
jgi:hypothetical protein